MEDEIWEIEKFESFSLFMTGCYALKNLGFFSESSVFQPPRLKHRNLINGFDCFLTLQDLNIYHKLNFIQLKSFLNLYYRQLTLI